MEVEAADIRRDEPVVQGYFDSRIKGFGAGIVLGVITLKVNGAIGLVGKATLFWKKTPFIELKWVDQMMTNTYQLLPRKYLQFVLNHDAFRTIIHAPVHEEILFRGAIQGALKIGSRPLFALYFKTISNDEQLVERETEISARWFAVLPTAVIFGIAHKKPVQQIISFTIGAIWGMVKETTGGNLAVTTGAHITNNAFVYATQKIFGEMLAATL